MITHTLAVNTVQSKYRIPRFRIDDDSSVDVYETKTSLASSLAESSFSKSSIEASAFVLPSH